MSLIWTDSLFPLPLLEMDNSTKTRVRAWRDGGGALRGSQWECAAERSAAEKSAGSQVLEKATYLEYLQHIVELGLRTKTDAFGEKKTHLFALFCFVILRRDVVAMGPAWHTCRAIYREGPKMPLPYWTGSKIPVSPAKRASTSLSYIGKASKFYSHRRDGPQTASPIWERPQNPNLAVETSLNQPLLYRKGLRTQSRRRGLP